MFTYLMQTHRSAPTNKDISLNISFYSFKMAGQQKKEKSAAILASKTRKLVVSEDNGKWGFLDPETGEAVVPFIYEYAHSFSVELALVRLNGWWGYVDKTGRLVIPCIYNPAWSFTKTGLAAVCIEGKCGFIDQTGEVIIPLVYDEARYFNKDGKAKVKLDGETFFIDLKGNRVE